LHGRVWPPQVSSSVEGDTPSWPKLSSPQQYPAPLVTTPQLCTMPALSWRNSRFVTTRRGVVLPFWSPVPIWPRGFPSQQYAKPEMSAPQVENEPTLSDAMAGELGTSCGVDCA